MAVSENIDVDTRTDWLFNSTFLTPDEEVLAPYGVEVRRATDGEYPSSYVSETGTAIDMGWVMSGDLSKLIIPNQDQTGAATTTGTFDFGKYFDDEDCYVDDGDGTLELGDRVNTAFGLSRATAKTPSRSMKILPQAAPFMRTLRRPISWPPWS